MHFLGYLCMQSVSGEMELVGIALDLSFHLFGFSFTRINICTRQMIKCGQWSQLSLEDTEHLMRTQQGHIIFQISIHSMSKISYQGLHEDMEMLKLGEMLGKKNWHSFALIFLILSYHFDFKIHALSRCQQLLTKVCFLFYDILIIQFFL